MVPRTLFERTHPARVQPLDRTPAMNVSTVQLTLALSLALAATTGCHREVPHAVPSSAPTARVQVAPVAATEHPSMEEIAGTVRAKTRALIEAKVTGRILRMETRLGTAFRAGDVLIELDAPEAAARVAQAQANVAQAARELARFRGLLTEKAVTPQEFDAVESRWRVATAALSEAETLAGYLRITAPFDGILTRKLTDVGDLATPGRELLEMEVPSRHQIWVDMPEGLLDRVTQGMKVGIHPGGSGSSLNAVLAEISPVADPGTRTVLIKADLPDGTGLRSGQFVRMQVPLGSVRTLTVPAGSVHRRGQLESVWVAQKGIATLRLVRTGHSMDGWIELLSGVEAGESVIVSGDVMDGQPVEVIP